MGKFAVCGSTWDCNFFVYWLFIARYSRPMRVIVSCTPSAIENRKQMVRVRRWVVGDAFKKGNIISEIQESSNPNRSQIS